MKITGCFLPLSSSFHCRRFALNSSQHASWAGVPRLPGRERPRAPLGNGGSIKKFLVLFLFFANCCSYCSTFPPNLVPKTQTWHTEEKGCAQIHRGRARGGRAGTRGGRAGTRGAGALRPAWARSPRPAGAAAAAGGVPLLTSSGPRGRRAFRARSDPRPAASGSFSPPGAGSPAAASRASALEFEHVF